MIYSLFVSQLSADHLHLAGNWDDYSNCSLCNKTQYCLTWRKSASHKTVYEITAFQMRLTHRLSLPEWYFSVANESWREARRPSWGLTCQLWNMQTNRESGAHQICHAWQICIRVQAAPLLGSRNIARCATAVPESQCSLITLHTYQITMQITFQPLTMQTA